ncbi:MAG: hypothetical protein WA994_09600 [Ornithinimicrobium sp.]
MSDSRSRPVRAGAAAISQLALLLLGAVVSAQVGGGPTPSGADVALAVTVLAVVVAALVSGLSLWLTDVSTRFMLCACGFATAAGTTYLLVGQLSVAAWLSAIVAVLAGAAWGRWVYAIFALVRPSRGALTDRIPERDRVGRPPGGAPTSGSAGEEIWSVDLSSPRMQRLALFGAVVFGAAIALSWGSAPWWWVAAIAVGGVAFCLVMEAWSAVRVDVDERGLSVTSRRVPVRLVQVRAQDVLGAGSDEVDPLAWGGWGLQWNARHTAYIRSGGPGIIVHRSSGRPLVIEIPQGTSVAEAGAVLLRRVAGRSALR